MIPNRHDHMFPDMLTTQTKPAVSLFEIYFFENFEISNLLAFLPLSIANVCPHLLLSSFSLHEIGIILKNYKFEILKNFKNLIISNVGRLG